MEDFIPYQKLSKKKRREYNNSKRNFWEVDPITKVVKNKKPYNRKEKYPKNYEELIDGVEDEE